MLLRYWGPGAGQTWCMSAQSTQRGFPAIPESPSVARHWVVDELGLVGRAAEDVQLLVSELVSNSVLHAGLPADALIWVRVARVDGGVRVEVCDEGGGLFAPSAHPHRRDGGRGLRIVRTLSSDCGLHHNGHTLLWFTYMMSPTASV